MDQAQVNLRIQTVLSGHFNHNVRKRTFGHVRPAKFQISLCIRAVWSESSLSAFWIARDVKFLPVDNKDWSVSADARADLNLLWARVRRHGFYLAAPLIHRTASINSVSGQWWVYPLAWVVLNIHCRNMSEDFFRLARLKWNCIFVVIFKIIEIVFLRY